MSEPQSEEPEDRLGLLQQARTHPGALADNRWKMWRIIDLGVGLNHQDLMLVIDAPDKDRDLAIRIIQWATPDGFRDLYMADFYRRLLNYLGSVASLVEHTRRLVKKYSDEELRLEYQRRVDAFIGNPIACFVQDLRDVFVHGKVPAVQVAIHAKGSGEDQTQNFRMSFARDELLRIDRFGVDARAYLSEQAEYFLIRDTIVDYSRMVQELDHWLMDQFSRLHGEDIAGFNALVDQILPLSGPLGSSENPVPPAP